MAKGHLNISISINQFLALSKSSDIDIAEATDVVEECDAEMVTEDLGTYDFSVTTTDFEHTQSEQENRLSRQISLKLSCQEPAKALAQMVEDGICEKDLSSFDGMAFSRYYLGDWEGAFIDDTMYDFDNDLKSESIESVGFELPVAGD